MKKAGTFLCGTMAAVLLAGCSSPMPDLTQEESDLISEYAVGILLKYDKNYGNRLVDTSAYEIVVEEPEEELPEEEAEQTSEVSADDAGAVDAGQSEEIAVSPTTVQEYYDINGIEFQYSGYELTQSYPSAADETALFFSMDATAGEQLLVLKFLTTNTSYEEQNLNMMDKGVKYLVSVNGEPAQRALTTMLLNDMQTYRDIMPAGSSTELVVVVEIPQSTSVESIDLILTGNGQNATLKLE